MKNAPCSSSFDDFQWGELPHAARKEPPPVVNEQPAIQDLVIADLEARKQYGLKKYGTLLQAFNGRDALMDAYQEALDRVVYLRQAYEEGIEDLLKLRQVMADRDALRSQ